MIIASLFCVGMYVLYQPGMILGKLPDYFSKALNNWTPERADLIVKLRKPLFDCLPCMSSVYGSIYYFTARSDTNYLIFLVTVCGLNYLFSRIVN